MRPNVRPMPSDFVEVASRLGVNALQAHFRAGQAAVERWMREAGITVQRRRPMPQDFIEQAKVLCRIELAKHYKTGDTQVNRWLGEAGITAAKASRVGGRPGDPPPEDFASVAPTMTRSALARHYGRHFRVIERWLDILDIDALAYAPPPKIEKPRQEKLRQSKPRQIRQRGYVRPGDYQIAKTKVSTIYDDAAFVLRAYSPTYRCDERGRFNEKGKFWRMGNALMTPDELLERAERYRSRAA